MKAKTVYVVTHTPWKPTLFDGKEDPIEEAYRHEREDEFESLTRAVAFARKAVKGDFFGEVTVEEMERTAKPGTCIFHLSPIPEGYRANFYR